MSTIELREELRKSFQARGDLEVLVNVDNDLFEIKSLKHVTDSPNEYLTLSIIPFLDVEK